ncbi:MAG: tRNA preQ1(34) S-adenosylmethionine ribosyltransferase-isomerase QueA [Oscillospiraceae bacterium]|nr:tRNA preQ1(34) S-adenosylmethionine ribosyltransferase-isomerase QueA [Oscillospiraceae bacterium]
MKKSDFNFNLPEELIAQTPIEKRDASRLLVLDKKTGGITHKTFFDITEFLNEGDCLVLNDSRVIPARLFGERITGGAVEVLLLKDLGDNKWEALTRPGRKTRIGEEIFFGNGLLKATVRDELPDGKRVVEFMYDGIFLEILDKLGEMPLPPYIHERLENPERYQTVYSKNIGSAAAPTAGLHFTEELLGKLKEKGVKTAFVTLHVGLGTFRPVKADDIKDHIMHSEYFEIPEESQRIISETKKSGGRIVAVGTTSCRTLESAFSESGEIARTSGDTDIFIYPGYKFRAVDALITNFHLPESTLIMLVSALAGRENVLNAYNIAIEEKYRFFSFGDAMFIH